MKIIYVGRFSHANVTADDEGAIAHVLEQLGHEVVRIEEEQKGYGAWRERGDFLLCNHWRDLDSLRKVKIPKVYWCFDLIDSKACNGGVQDTTLTIRDKSRIQWSRDMIHYCDLGFHTDGDWVDRCKKELMVGDNAHWLMQGADERIVGRGQFNPSLATDILITASRRGGVRRETFLHEMEKRWGSRIKVVEKGIYRERLRDLIASSKIVVAPDFPCSQRYWSNRVYNVLGFGGFLLHPQCSGLIPSQFNLAEVMTYFSRSDLNDAIELYLGDEFKDRREGQGNLSIKAISTKHLYRHRVEEMVRVVRDRLKI